MNVREKVVYWDSIAAYDMETARAMLESGRLLYVGFMCQQTIEKGLKAFHWSHISTEPEFTHALTRLAKKSGIFEDMDQETRDFLEVLEPLNIEARYPTYKEKLLASLTVDRCRWFIAETEKVFQWLQARYLK
jgi:HEPN domain-containing protein